MYNLGNVRILPTVLGKPVQPPLSCNYLPMEIENILTNMPLIFESGLEHYGNASVKIPSIIRSVRVRRKELSLFTLYIRQAHGSQSVAKIRLFYNDNITALEPILNAYLLKCVKQLRTQLNEINS